MAKARRRRGESPIKQQARKWFAFNAHLYSNLTEAAENCAWALGHDEWLDDPDHWVWDLAVDYLGVSFTDEMKSHWPTKRNPPEPRAPMSRATPIAVDQVVMTIWTLFESRYPDDEGDNLNPIHVEQNKGGRWVVGFDDWVWSYGLNDTYTYSPKTKTWEVYLGDVGVTRRGWATAAVLHRVDRIMDPTMTRVNPEQCGGTMYNGPGKRYTRCSVCKRIDWELNEGDRCRFPKLPTTKKRKRGRQNPHTPPTFTECVSLLRAHARLVGDQEAVRAFGLITLYGDSAALSMREVTNLRSYVKSVLDATDAAGSGEDRKLHYAASLLVGYLIDNYGQ